MFFKRTGSVCENETVQRDFRSLSPLRNFDQPRFVNRLTKLLTRATTVIALLTIARLATANAVNLERSFRQPPTEARPWVYWFWLNGNITSNGITADLAAMKRVGLGGVLIMEVDEGAPVGPADFMGPRWRDLFTHAQAEARRLGLEVNMNNDAGWNGSGGPWIKPELSMQEVVWTETNLAGGQHFEGPLAQPETTAGFYRDLAVLAFPTVGDYRIPNIESKAAFHKRDRHQPSKGDLGSDSIIQRQTLTNLTAQMDPTGRFVWDVPPGQWTVLRCGHTSTGVENAPAPKSGRGLECDKLSKAGIEANFAGMMTKLAAEHGPKSSTKKPALIATHIDSWENGTQNWTAQMREEFQRRRGYDLFPFLPVMTGRVVGSLEISERFLWDLRQTISELIIENYAGHFHHLANAAGLRFTVEAYGLGSYGGPCDSIPYGGQSDEPMGEFWTPGGATIETCKAMASAGHIYCQRIIGAEAFTANEREKWREHPATLKALGDRVFCEGINRFVIHRYALQPWSPERRPGMMMGPWGQHYERTQTWWEWTPAWHEYLARCQFMLRQGLFVADICHVQPEAPPQGPGDHKRAGYNWDECTAEAVLTRMSVKDGRIVLPDGMSYRVLALSSSRTMTPALLRKVKKLVQAGATVLGPKPSASPSLSGFPECDDEVKQLAAELWGNPNGDSVKEHRVGRGRVIWSDSPEKTLAESGVPADFSSRQPLRFIHRRTDRAEIYFVANPLPHELTTTCGFRVTDKAPEFWWPDTGRLEPAALWQEQDGVTHVVVPFAPGGSVFVVFRERARKPDAVVLVKRDGKPILSASPEPRMKIVVRKARYGVLDDPLRTRDVREKVQRLVDADANSFVVARMAEGDNPAINVLKTLELDITVNGEPHHLTGTDPELINLVPATAPPWSILAVRGGKNGRALLETVQPGEYELVTAARKTRRVTIPAGLPESEVSGPWRVRFAPNGGAPAEVRVDKLISWSRHSDPGVKYFSGEATYRTTFVANPKSEIRNPKWYLDLGRVEVMAEVKLNGKALGVLWKPPFRVEVTEALKRGQNKLEVKVVNLWPNRLIGDEQLPEDSERNPDGTLKQWPQWLLDGQPSPTGRQTFASWRLWKKDDALLESGLLGPVQLLAAETITLK